MLYADLPWHTRLYWWLHRTRQRLLSLPGVVLCWRGRHRWSLEICSMSMDGGVTWHPVPQCLRCQLVRRS